MTCPFDCFNCTMLCHIHQVCPCDSNPHRHRCAASITWAGSIAIYSPSALGATSSFIFYVKMPSCVGSHDFYLSVQSFGMYVGAALPPLTKSDRRLACMCWRGSAGNMLACYFGTNAACMLKSYHKKAPACILACIL